MQHKIMDDKYRRSEMKKAHLADVDPFRSVGVGGGITRRTGGGLDLRLISPGSDTMTLRSQCIEWIRR